MKARHTHLTLIAASILSVALPTFAAVLPTVNLNSMSRGYYQRAGASAVITNDGGGTISSRGMVYSEIALNSSPQLGGPNVFQAVSFESTPTFRTHILDLKPGVEYTFRAYATNEAGTSYSSASIITTTSIPSAFQTGFSGDGIASEDLGETDNAGALVAQPDSKVITLVNRQDAGRASLIRHTGGGILDTTFSGDGRVDLVVPSSTSDGLTGIVLQNDGKIVVTGQSTFGDGTRQIVVARFLSDGSPDPDFDTDGVVVVNASNLEYGLTGSNAQALATDLAVQSDGKIVVCGRVRRNSSSKDNGLALRLNASGSLDASFGVNGIVGVVATGTESTSFAGLELQPDDKVVLGGTMVVSGFNFQCVAARLEADGDLDPTFDGDGLLLFEANQLEGGAFNEVDQVMDVKLAPDGGILLAIQADTASFTSRFFVAKVSRTNGTLDSSFGGNGIVNTGFLGTPSKMEVQDNGRILITGSSASFNFALVRLLPSGALDLDWDGDGILTNSSFSTGMGLSISPFGLVYASALDNAFTGGSAHVFRFNGDGVHRLRSTIPADDATNVPVSTNLVLDYGGAELPNSGSFQILDAATLTLVESIPVNDPRVTGFGSPLITVDPNTTLSPATKYYVTLDYDAIRNSGTAAPVQGIFNTEWEFVTEGAVTAPEIAVSEPGVGNIADGGSFSFGTTTVGTPVTKTFTVTNSGTANLTLSGLSAPSGFSIASNFGTGNVGASGGTTTFQITMLAAAPATPSGSLSFTNNDSDENPFNFTLSGTVNPAPVAVSSLNRAGTTPTNASSVSWTLTFAGAVTGVTASNFSLSGAASAGSSIGTPATGDGGLTWTIPITTGSTDGPLTLNLANATGLSAPLSTPLPFVGESYTLDKTPPQVVSVTRQNPTGQTTASTTLTFRVTYTEPVTLTAPEATHFQIVPVNGSNIVGTITGVTGGGSTRDVTVDITSGTGEFRLRVID